MKSKVFARILCIVLCATLIGSVLLVAIPMITANAAGVVTTGGSGTINDDYVNLRSGAGTNFSVVTMMRKNTKVTFISATLYNNSWYNIRTSGGSVGYVMKDYVTADEAAGSIKLCRSALTTYANCQYAFWQTGASKPTWKSSNTSVATIDSNGIMTGKSAGTTTITVSEGSASASCKVTLLNGTSTGMSPTSLTVEKGKTATLSTKTSGVSWFSSNTNVVTVSNGTVTAKAVGYATVSAYTTQGSSTCLIHVTEATTPALKITMCRSTLTTYGGCQYAFWQTGADKPTWTSSDTSVATVDSNGVMTGKSAGTTTITASQNGCSASCKVTLLNGTSTGMSPTSLTVEKGKTATLSTKASGVSWFSSNTNVVTVSNGTVTAKAVGYATVSAYTTQGSSTCLIHVTEATTPALKITMCRSTLTTYGGCQYAFWQTGADKPTWTSSDTSVATVDSNGVMTGKSAGTTTITASQNGSSASCKVTLINGTSTGMSPTTLTVEKGRTSKLTTKTSGVSWFSSNTNVVTVSNGTVTAKALGYATVSAYTTKGSSTCLIHVVAPTATSDTKGIINGDYVNLRSGAGTNYSIVANMRVDTIVTLVSETPVSGWYHIKLDDGTIGYVKGDYLTIKKKPTIKMCRSSATIYKGCQYALWQTGAENPEWTSSNTSVATVDANGIVTAKAEGTATITASEWGGKATCTFTILSGTSTGISKSSLSVEAGKTAKLTATASDVSWFSSNTNVATVSGGTITAKAEGFATISAYNLNGSSTCLVTVTKASTPSTGIIKLNRSAVTIYKGCQFALGMTGATSASWSSSNTSVATVDSHGVVTAKGTGSCTVRAANSVSSANCTITVWSGSSTGISLTSGTISSGKSILLKANSGVSWSSSNSSVATVSNGIVDTKAPGYVTIHAYTYSGSSTCLLHVTAPDAVRFVYATPNSAPLNSKVTFKAITDLNRTAVKFTATSGTHSVSVTASNKVKDGNTYVWTGSATLSYSGKWKIKAYSKTASTDYAGTTGNGEGEVFVTNSTNTTTTVTGERRASDEIIELIANFEGFLTSVTPDYITTDPTLGYGKVVTRNEQFYNNLTKNEAYAYLCQTVNSGGYTIKTNEFLTSNGIKFNQRQFDALVCFTYNVGAYAIYNDSSLSSVLLNTGSSGTASIKAGAAGYVNASSVNLRSGAGTNYSVLTNMAQNTAFTFVDGKLYNSSWYKIKLTNGTVGYIYSEYASAKATGGTRDLNNVNKSVLIPRFLQYHHAAGSCYWGLLYRRIDEMEIFFYGDYARDGQNNKYGMYFRCANNSSFGIG